MGIIEGAKKIGAAELGMGELKVAVGLYDFAVEGGATGDIALRGDKIPNGARIVEAYLDVTTVPTSAGAATIAVKSEGAADINAADAILGAPWSTAGIKRADALVGADKGVKATAERTITLTVGTAALTAGVFKVIVLYFELG